MQTKITKASKTEERLERMINVASREHMKLIEEMRQLDMKKRKWFMAFHELRVIGDVAREVGFSEQKLQKLIEDNAAASEEISFAYINSHVNGSE